MVGRGEAMDDEPLIVVAGSIHHDHLLRLPRLPVVGDREAAVGSSLVPGCAMRECGVGVT